jgi:hypothetical protein
MSCVMSLAKLRERVSRRALGEKVRNLLTKWLRCSFQSVLVKKSRKVGNYMSIFKLPTCPSLCGRTVCRGSCFDIASCRVQTQPPIQRVPGVKRPGREADHSRPSSAEVKNEWSYIYTPQHVFMPRCLVKPSDTFIVRVLRDPFVTHRERWWISILKQATTAFPPTP